jgi:hypothetical protein
MALELLTDDARRGAFLGRPRPPKRLPPGRPRPPPGPPGRPPKPGRPPPPPTTRASARRHREPPGRPPTPRRGTAAGSPRPAAVTPTDGTPCRRRRDHRGRPWPGWPPRAIPRDRDATGAATLAHAGAGRHAAAPDAGPCRAALPLAEPDGPQGAAARAVTGRWNGPQGAADARPRRWGRVAGRQRAAPQVGSRAARRRQRPHARKGAAGRRPGRQAGAPGGRGRTPGGSGRAPGRQRTDPRGTVDGRRDRRRGAALAGPARTRAGLGRGAGRRSRLGRCAARQPGWAGRAWPATGLARLPWPALPWTWLTWPVPELPGPSCRRLGRSRRLDRDWPAWPVPCVGAQPPRAGTCRSPWSEPGLAGPEPGGRHRPTNRSLSATVLAHHRRPNGSWPPPPWRTALQARSLDGTPSSFGDLIHPRVVSTRSHFLVVTRARGAGCPARPCSLNTRFFSASTAAVWPPAVSVTFRGSLHAAPPHPPGPGRRAARTDRPHGRRLAGRVVGDRPGGRPHDPVEGTLRGRRPAHPHPVLRGSALAPACRWPPGVRTSPQLVTTPADLRAFPPPPSTVCTFRLPPSAPRALTGHARPPGSR